MAEPFFDERVQRELRGVLAGREVSRLWELRELETEVDYELDLTLFEPTYNGSEGFWIDSSFEWLVYASHEDSVTVSGAELLPTLKAAWPAWRDWTHQGWR